MNMSVSITEPTVKNPLELIGKTAGVCWGSDVTNRKKNIKRAIDCIKSGHGRVLEWVELYSVIDNASARVMREFERHHVVASFLQASTRYVDYTDFQFYTPPDFTEDKKAILDKGMKSDMASYKALIDSGVSKEDAANMLPLGMSTRIVDKRNLRNFIEMCHQRLCSRAYKEYRQLMKLYLKVLSSYSPEWAFIVKYLCVPKCKVVGYCTEKDGCGLMPKKDMLSIDQKDIDSLFQGGAE